MCFTCQVYGANSTNFFCQSSLPLPYTTPTRLLRLQFFFIYCMIAHCVDAGRNYTVIPSSLGPLLHIREPIENCTLEPNRSMQTCFPWPQPGDQPSNGSERSITHSIAMPSSAISPTSTIVPGLSTSSGNMTTPTLRMYPTLHTPAMILPTFTISELAINSPLPTNLPAESAPVTSPYTIFVTPASLAKRVTASACSKPATIGTLALLRMTIISAPQTPELTAASMQEPTPTPYLGSDAASIMTPPFTDAVSPTPQTSVITDINPTASPTSQVTAPSPGITSPHPTSANNATLPIPHTLGDCTLVPDRSMQICFPWPHKPDATTKRDVVAVSSDTPWDALGSATTFVTEVRSRHAHGVTAMGE
jgi:hypothetical protein